MAKISSVSQLIKIFIDSDVIISSLLSQTGATYIILNSIFLKAFISNFSYEELNRVVNKLEIDKNRLEKLVKERLKTVKIGLDKDEILNKFGNYAYDMEDVHIVAGSKVAKAKFLITFNIKDYKIKEIYRGLGIKVMRPGQLLQYLRSLE